MRVEVCPSSLDKSISNWTDKRIRIDDGVYIVTEEAEHPRAASSVSDIHWWRMPIYAWNVTRPWTFEGVWNGRQFSVTVRGQRTSWRAREEAIGGLGLILGTLMFKAEELGFFPTKAEVLLPVKNRRIGVFAIVTDGSKAVFACDDVPGQESVDIELGEGRYFQIGKTRYAVACDRFTVLATTTAKVLMTQLITLKDIEQDPKAHKEFAGAALKETKLESMQWR